MKSHTKLTFALTMSLLLLSVLIALVPGSAADEHEGDHKNLAVHTDEYWAENIAYNDSSDTFRISVEEVNGLSIDVYILSSGEFEKYKNELDFKASYFRENTSSTGKTDWTCPDDQYYYLVVDNRDNAHDDDAYANESVSVNVSWLNRTEKKEEEDAERFARWFCGFGVVVCCILPIILIIVIVYWFEVRPDRRSPTPYPNQPIGQASIPAPHYQPMRNPPMTPPPQQQPYRAPGPTSQPQFQQSQEYPTQEPSYPPPPGPDEPRMVPPPLPRPENLPSEPPPLPPEYVARFKEED